MENEVDISYKQKALQLLQEAKNNLQIYDNKRPIIQSMKSDIQYFEDYFSQVSVESLEVLNTQKQTSILFEKTLETTIPKEKLEIQKEILNQVLQIFSKYQDNNKVKEILLQAYINYSWFAIRSNMPKEAISAINKGLNLDTQNVTLKTNQAHLFLIQNETQKAKEIYQAVYRQKNSQNETIATIIDKDLKQLQKDGLISFENKNMKEILDIIS
jgi:ABC-type uncharacterized transport system auxiliary subunit